MDKAKTTPKDFFLWAGAMISLYWSVAAFIGLIFNYINYAFPNVDSVPFYPINPYENGVSFEMASLIILFPLSIVLLRVIHRDIAKEPSRATIWVRRWALFLTLFIAGATMAIDLVTALSSFLNGTDVGLAFVFKFALVFLVAAGLFMHFLADFWGYWDTYPARGHMAGYAAGVLVLVSILSGFFIFGSPAHARQVYLEQQKTYDAQNMQMYYAPKPAAVSTSTPVK